MANYTMARSWWRTRQRRRGGAYFGAFGAPIGSEPEHPFSQIARNGELVYLTHPMTVFYGGDLLGERYGRELPAGAVRCNEENFGVPSNVAWRFGCHVKTSDLAPYLETRPALASKVASGGQGFRVETAGHVYYLGVESQRGIRQFVSSGSFVCSNQNFGPDPAWGKAKECWFVPAPGEGVVEEGAPITYYDELAAQYATMQRAETARQAQLDMMYAQAAVLEDRATEAARQAQIAENAQAQAAAALASAEAYRQIQEDAQRQAAEYAAELARLAAASHADPDAAAAAAQVAAEAEAIRQALAEARAHEAEQRAAYDAALAATQAEIRNQERAEAQLDAATNAAAQYAENAAAGAAGVPGQVGMSDLLLYGGLAAAAAILFLAD